MVCFFLSGAAGLIYEVAWTKSLGLLFGHTAYASTTVLAVFMAGLASGSLWLGQRAERVRQPLALYGWIELGVAATGAASLAGLSGVRWLYYHLYPLVSHSGLSLLAVRIVGASLVLIVPSFLMGGTLPILVCGLTPRGSKGSTQIGRRLSRLYWVNTLGAVAGAIAAGFLLLPTVGLRLSVASAVLLNACGVALRVSRHFELIPPSLLRAKPEALRLHDRMRNPENPRSLDSCSQHLPWLGPRQSAMRSLGFDFSRLPLEVPHMHSH